MTRPPLDLGSWCILRMASGDTLKVAASLTAAGLEAWAPADDDDTPLTKTYAFARMAHLHELLALVRSPSLTCLVWDPELRRMVTRGVPYFRLMRDPLDATNWATVSDRQLAPLRGIEWGRKPRGQVKTIPVDTKVRLDDGGFAGLDGVVVEVRGKFATVVFEGLPFPVEKIPCWKLTEQLDEGTDINVSRRSSEQALPAKAA
jgi:hypothetical protein